MIWIVVHHVGENPTNMIRTLPTPVHVSPTYASCGQSLYVATFWEVINNDGQSHCSWEKGLLTQSTTRRLTDPWVHTQFLSRASHWSSGGKATLYRQPATRLTRLISPACDQHIEYLLVGANPSVLNRHRRGLQPWRCQLSTYHSPTFLTSCLYFPLRAPPGLRLSQPTITNWTKGRSSPKPHEWEPPLEF
jgi:hypothetical protein